METVLKMNVRHPPDGISVRASVHGDVAPSAFDDLSAHDDAMTTDEG